MTAKRSWRSVLLGVLVSAIVGLVLLAALAVAATTTHLEPGERATLVTAPEVIKGLEGDFARVQQAFGTRRTRGGGVELSYDGLSRRRLRVKSWARLEPTPEVAARTFSSWAADGLANAGFDAKAWGTRPCELTLGLGDQSSCLLLTEGEERAGTFLVVRAKERLLIVLVIGAWFSDADELRELLTPHLDALAALKPLSVFD